MQSFESQGQKKPNAPADDEVGKPIWKIPATDEVDEDETDEEEDDEVGEIHPAPRSEGGIEIYAPDFDPLQQQEWEEQEKLRRQHEEENEKGKNPRGLWRM